jgi:hypothetical protein
MKLAALSENVERTNSLLERLFAMPRESRAKYDVLRLIVPVIGSRPVLSHSGENFVSELVECCLSTRPSGSPHLLLIALLDSAYTEVCLSPPFVRLVLF